MKINFTTVKAGVVLTINVANASFAVIHPLVSNQNFTAEWDNPAAPNNKQIWSATDGGLTITASRITVINTTTGAKTEL